MRVLLASVVLPWMFGPYAQQLQMVGQDLMNRNHSIYWLGVTYSLEERVYTAEDIAKASNVPSRPSGKGVEFAERVKFLAIQKEKYQGALPVMALNRLISLHHIDVFVSLMDLDKFTIDEPLIVPSIAWWPNHFAELDEVDRTALGAFTHVAALSPSSEAMLARSMPELHVQCIPHAIVIPESVRSAGPASLARAALRVQYGVPEDAFLVLVSAGNYEFHNRKSLDTSLLAFKVRVLNPLPLTL